MYGFPFQNISVKSCCQLWFRVTSPGQAREFPARPVSSTSCTMPPTTSWSEPRPSSRTPSWSLMLLPSDNGNTIILALLLMLWPCHNSTINIESYTPLPIVWPSFVIFYHGYWEFVGALLLMLCSHHNSTINIESQHSSTHCVTLCHILPWVLRVREAQIKRESTTHVVIDSQFTICIKIPSYLSSTTYDVIVIHNSTHLYYELFSGNILPFCSFTICD